MAFVELAPTKIALADLAVTVSRGVLYVSLAGTALAALQTATACRVLYDEESRVVRIVSDPDGAFALGKLPPGRASKDGKRKKREAYIVRVRADAFQGMVSVSKAAASFKIPAAGTIEFTLPTTKVAPVTIAKGAPADARELQKDLEREMLEGPQMRTGTHGGALSPRGRDGRRL